MSKSLTDEQRYAVELALKSRGDLKIEAFAGTGKTTTLRAIGEAMGSKKGLYLAFNSSIAQEAAKSFPQTVLCKTVHALAFRDTGRIYKDRLKNRLTAQSIASQLNVSDWHSFKATALCQMAHQTVSRFCQSDAETLGKRHTPRETIKSLAATGPIDSASIQEVVLGIARELWRSMEDPKQSIPVTPDFYLKKWSLSSPRLSFDYLMLDEAQDANALLLKIIRSAEIPVIFVGDQYQQIYSWRGAVNAMRKFETNSVARLTQSFRFGERIADVANEVLIDVLGSSVAIRGNPRIDSSIRELSQPRAVLCRTNAEAIEQLTRAIGEGRKAALQGGTEEISSLVRGMEDLMIGKRPMQQELVLFSDWEQFKAYVELDMGKDLQPVLSLVEKYGARELLRIFDRVSMNKEENSDVVISTVHKAKGREWSSVLLGSDFRGPDDKNYHDEEGNLLYVAITRAMHTLDISACDGIDQIRKKKAEELDRVRARDAQPSTSSALAALDSSWTEYEDEDTIESGMDTISFLHQEETLLMDFSRSLALVPRFLPHILDDELSAPLAKPSSNEGQKKQRLTGEKAETARSFLEKAMREGKNTLLHEASAADAWAQLRASLETDEGLNSWVDNFMSPPGRKRMFATLRQAAYSQKVETKQIRVSEELYEELSRAADEDRLPMQELLARLLQLRSVNQRNPAPQLDL